MSDNAYRPIKGSDSTYLFLQVGGEIFDDWQDCSITSDLLEPAGRFSFSSPIYKRGVMLREIQSKGLRKGARVRVFIKTPKAPEAVLQMTGLIDEVKVSVSRNGGAVLAVTGRDHMAPIVDGDIMQRFAVENVTFRALVERVLLTPFPGRTTGYFASSDQLIISNDANRLILTGKSSTGLSKNLGTPFQSHTGGSGVAAQSIVPTGPLSPDAPPELETLKVDQAVPNAGETVYQFLERHARRFALMIWGTADGRIVFGRPNYRQAPSYAFALRIGAAGASNSPIVDASRKESMKHCASEIHVFGPARGHDTFASPVHVRVADPEVEAAGYYKPIVIHDAHAKDNAQATARAQMELSKRTQSSDVVQLALDGYVGNTGALYAIDTLADCQLDPLDVHESLYVVRRTFSRSRSGGSMTTLDLIPKNSIALGQVQYVTPASPKVLRLARDLGK